MNLLAFFIVLFFSSCAFASDLRDEVFWRLNQIRIAHGLEKLTPESKLTVAAQSQSDWMASVGRMDHLRGSRPESIEQFKVCLHHPVNRVISTGYYGFDEVFKVIPNDTGVVVEPTSASNNIDEIIAYGIAPGKEAYRTDIIVQGWMKSPGHRKSILTSHYKELGIGISSPKQGEVYWCVVFGTKER